MFSKLIRDTMPESPRVWAAATPLSTRSSQGTLSSSDQRGKRPIAAMPGSSSKRLRPSSSNAPPASFARHTSTRSPRASGLLGLPRLLLRVCTII
ncbi:UNVERIFIED_CONTAM: hypothetical protein Sangu_1429700 [Sesamum angustifolium]|uniref:Uncharacterized protein n=1 Tax=Sesamum angustifolium TaxID=2727405 RepID=A0AAW2N6K7_9LAMI